MGCENDVKEWATVTKPCEMDVETDNGSFTVSLTLLEQNLDRIKSSKCLYKGYNMLKKVLCYLLGHQFIAKIFTGNMGRTYHPLIGVTTTREYFRYEAQKWCLRCGCLNHNKDTK